MERPIGKYELKASKIGRIVDKKNKAYGNSFNEACEILTILYPNGVEPKQYKDMLALTRIIDKLFRIANDKGFEGESPFRDIAGYGILGDSTDKKIEEK